MTRDTGNEPQISYGDVGRIYREKLSKVPDAPYKHIRVLNEHFLFSDGHVKRSVSVLIQALSDGVNTYWWRVPVVNKNSKVTGLRVSPNKDVEGYVLKEDEDFRTIQISICPLKKGGRTQLQFEYYVTKACEVSKNGVFFKELKYPFAYKPTSTTESFEFRLHLPLSADLKIISNLPTPETFQVGNNQLVIASEEEFSTGDIVGNLLVRFRTSAYIPLISIALGSISTILLAIVKYGDNYIGAWHLALIPVFMSALFFAALKLFRVD
jgi:hypothetical protein